MTIDIIVPIKKNPQANNEMLLNYKENSINLGNLENCE